VERIKPDVTARWRSLEEKDCGLGQSGCLYAMLSRRERQIVYIGKASRTSVAERLRCRAKDAMWQHLADCEIDGCHVLLGELTLHTYSRLTDPLLSDVESLLIMAEQPIGNMQSKRSRIERRGLCVACTGRWPGRARLYIDGVERNRPAA
jgi:hypothetical protein